MDPEAIEVALEDGSSLGEFRRAVAAIKRDPELTERYADRVAAGDVARFREWALLVVPLTVGTVLAVVATAAGLGLAAATYYVGRPWNGLLLLAAAGVLLVSTHGLAHLAVGRAYGIRFSAWFIGSLFRPQPGVKVEYASYLRAPARRRAWMHASGALVSKAVPFLLLGPALIADTPAWTWAALLALGVGSIITDALWSVTKSDWKRFRREMAMARVVEG